MVPCSDVTQPRLCPDQQHDAEHGCSGLRATYTSFLWGTLFSNIFILRREVDIYHQSCASKSAHILGNKNKTTHRWFLWIKILASSISMALHPCALVPDMSQWQMLQRKAFLSCISHQHIHLCKIITIVFKWWTQWPVLPLSFPSFVPSLFLHIDFLFFSHGGDWD